MSYTTQDKKNHIHEMQTYLYKISATRKTIPIVIPDGVYGKETVESVRLFQRSITIPVTGQVDYYTWKYLTNEYSKLIQES